MLSSFYPYTYNHEGSYLPNHYGTDQQDQSKNFYQQTTYFEQEPTGTHDCMHHWSTDLVLHHPHHDGSHGYHLACSDEQQIRRSTPGKTTTVAAEGRSIDDVASGEAWLQCPRGRTATTNPSSRPASDGLAAGGATSDDRLFHGRSSNPTHLLQAVEEQLPNPSDPPPSSPFPTRSSGEQGSGTAVSSSHVVMTPLAGGSIIDGVPPIRQRRLLRQQAHSAIKNSTVAEPHADRRTIAADLDSPIVYGRSHLSPKNHLANHP
ncbi:hypothetical protein ACLOJK_027547 [Asimina triloba]